VSRRYSSAGALRVAIETRLAREAAETGRNLQWLRRRLVFTRMLARLVVSAPDGWVLKGGMAVELRRPGLARATRDIDLVLRRGVVADPGEVEQVREALLDALLDDVDGDWFGFRVLGGTQLRDDAYGRPAWRYTVEASLAGKRFAEQRVDVVARPEELDGVEALMLPDLLGFAGIAPRAVPVTDLRQQFAEKLHALTRTYAAGESTRVKDLVDLVLLVEDAVPADRSLYAAVHRVFAVRGTHDVPGEIQPPPVGWQVPFARLIEEIALPEVSLVDAHALVADHWRRALHVELEEDGRGTPEGR